MQSGTSRLWRIPLFPRCVRWHGDTHLYSNRMGPAKKTEKWLAANATSARRCGLLQALLQLLWTRRMDKRAGGGPVQPTTGGWTHWRPTLRSSHCPQGLWGGAIRGSATGSRRSSPHEVQLLHNYQILRKIFYSSHVVLYQNLERWTCRGVKRLSAQSVSWITWCKISTFYNKEKKYLF